MVRAEVQAFAEAMEQELAANDYKGGWQQMRRAVLFKRLLEEVEELRQALVECRDPPVVLSEAADVANFAMMLADVYGALQVVSPPA